MDHGSSDDDFSDDDDEEPQESLKEVERRLAARFRADADRESQASRIFKTLAMRARKRADADGMSSGEYEDVLQQICGVLEDFEGGFNAHLRERKQGQLWWAQHPDVLRQRNEKWCGEVSPVDADEVERAAAKYLSKPWLQCDQLDWMIVNALLFNEVAGLAEAIKTGQLLGRINWVYVFSGSLEKTVVWRLGLSLLAFLSRWVVPPAAVAWLVIEGRETLALYVAVPWILYVIYRVVTLPFRFVRRRAEAKRVQSLMDLYEAAQKAWAFSNGQVVNPTRLKALIVEAEQKGPSCFRAVVHSVLDRAIQRDPAVLLA